MGSGLSAVSSTCLPYPVDQEEIDKIEKLGVTYTKRHEDKVMGTVVLAQNRAIYCDYYRGDIWRGYLVNTEGKLLAYINWMSKGSYDNVASICVTSYESRKLNVEHMDLVEGVYRPIPSLAQEYCDMLNQYAGMPAYGSSQNTIDNYLDEITLFAKAHPEAVWVAPDRLLESTKKDSDAMFAMCTGGRTGQSRYIVPESHLPAPVYIE